MYKILPNLAVHGFNGTAKITKVNMTIDEMEVGEIDGFVINDVRYIDDLGGNDIKDYLFEIDRISFMLSFDMNVVVCCEAGQSRSNAIALGVLIKHFNMDFYDAWELIKKKNPTCNIDPSHIVKLKKLFGVTTP